MHLYGKGSLGQDGPHAWVLSYTSQELNVTQADVFKRTTFDVVRSVVN